MTDPRPLHPSQLDEALRRLHPRGWPRTVAAVLADPIRARILKGYARVLARRHARQAERQFRLPRFTFDARRAAANDHDD